MRCDLAIVAQFSRLTGSRENVNKNNEYTEADGATQNESSERSKYRRRNSRFRKHENQQVRGRRRRGELAFAHSTLRENIFQPDFPRRSSDFVPRQIPPRNLSSLSAGARVSLRTDTKDRDLWTHWLGGLDRRRSNFSSSTKESRCFSDKLAPSLTKSTRIGQRVATAWNFHVTSTRRNWVWEERGTTTEALVTAVRYLIPVFHARQPLYISDYNTQRAPSSWIEFPRWSSAVTQGRIARECNEISARRLIYVFHLTTTSVATSLIAYCTQASRGSEIEMATAKRL